MESQNWQLGRNSNQVILTTIKVVTDSIYEDDFLTMSSCELRQLFAATTHCIISVLEGIGMDEAPVLCHACFTMYSSQASHM